MGLTFWRSTRYGSQGTGRPVLLRSQDGEPGSLGGQNLFRLKLLKRHLFGVQPTALTLAFHSHKVRGASSPTGSFSADR
jgi:hypothetical protein